MKEFLIQLGGAVLTAVVFWLCVLIVADVFEYVAKKTAKGWYTAKTKFNIKEININLR